MEYPFGLWPSGLRRVLWEHEIVGSNPTSPTKLDIESFRKGVNQNPTIETLTRIAKALNVGVDDLLK